MKEQESLTRRVYLGRHGEYAKDCTLTDMAIKTEILKGYYFNWRGLGIDIALSSPIIRAKETLNAFQTCKHKGQLFDWKDNPNFEVNDCFSEGGRIGLGLLKLWEENPNANNIFIVSHLPAIEKYSHQELFLNDVLVMSINIESKKKFEIVEHIQGYYIAGLLKKFVTNYRDISFKDFAAHIKESCDSGELAKFFEENK